MLYRLLPAIVIFVSSIVYSQTTTYSKEEENMVGYVNMGWAYAYKYNSYQDVKPIIDSCWSFLNIYPNSFAKPNVFSYLLEMNVLISKDLKVINPLIDSVLYYDSLSTTKQRIGALLIERNLDLKRGREFVLDALPNLSVKNQIFRSYMLLAKSDLTLGTFASAKINFEYALKTDSTRSEGWYEYLSFLRIRELTQEANVVSSKIAELEKQSKIKFVTQSSISPNINKEINKITLLDLDSNVVELSSLNGKVVVINRFNFWCGICAKEFPALQKLIKEFPEVKFIFINSGETTSELRDRYFKMKEFSFLKKQQVLFITKEYYDEIYGDSVPHNLVVDKDGVIRFDYQGYNKEMEGLLRNNLNTLLKK
ncbi:MAG: TlpA family protein disulfide reductase [Ignavibacteriales bacterium]|nr:TlpA family protein disulfide reductase [Ignavibacteriales bacterium]